MKWKKLFCNKSHLEVVRFFKQVEKQSFELQVKKVVSEFKRYFLFPSNL